jgi:hypothetical protein
VYPKERNIGTIESDKTSFIHLTHMSQVERLPEEIEELFQYSDGNGLLTEEDLEKAGFQKERFEYGNHEVWRKNNVELEYEPQQGEILDYNERR